VQDHEARNPERDLCNARVEAGVIAEIVDVEAIEQGAVEFVTRTWPGSKVRMSAAAGRVCSPSPWSVQKVTLNRRIKAGAIRAV
jgi:hypothetical protein